MFAGPYCRTSGRRRRYTEQHALLSQKRNTDAGRGIWTDQLDPLIRSFNIKRETGWLEFTAVTKKGSVSDFGTPQPIGRTGRKTNDPVCMGRDPLPHPQGAISIEKGLTTLAFVAGGTPNNIGYESDGDIPRVYQFAVAGAQMQKVVAQKDGTHLIHSNKSPHIRKFPMQGSPNFDFQTTGPQPKAGGAPPNLIIVSKPPGTVRLDFPFMSSAFLTPRIEQGQWRATGDFTPTKPVLKGAQVHLEVADEELRGGVKLDAAALRAALPVPGLVIDPVTLEIGIANGDWHATGGFGFRYGNLVKGSLEASFANGVQAKGIAELMIPGIDEARGEVWIREGRFGGKITVAAKQLRFPNVKDAKLTATIQDGVMSGDGSVVMSIPSLDDVTLKFAANRR